MRFNRGFKFLVDIGRNLRLVESSGILRYGVGFSRNLRLVDLSRFLRLRFGVRVTYRRIFLFITGGGK